MEETDAIVLRFRRSGAAFGRAAEVARFMGMDIEDYLFRCIERGHVGFRSDMERELDTIPSFLREDPAAGQ